MKISVISPTIRPETLALTAQCLEKQIFEDFEWLIVTPKDKLPFSSLEFIPFKRSGFFKWIEEPKRREEDFYGLNKAWNAAFKKAEGELIVSIVDQTWFPPDTLQMFWDHYEANPKACITGIGHQYEDSGNNEPQVVVWKDPRDRSDQGSFYETFPTEMEFCVASLPKQALIDVGGIDEEFDKYAALSEKDLMARVEKAGYKLYIDNSIRYKAIKHDRIGGKEEWDKHYFAGCDYYEKCIKEIIAGTRKKLDFLG